jgi:hypothetical protein
VRALLQLKMNDDFLVACLEAHPTQNEEERRQAHLTRDRKAFMRDYGAPELIGSDAERERGNDLKPSRSSTSLRTAASCR